MPRLPGFIPPMLATLGRPFDSDEHVFELKWDGFRSIAYRDASGYRLLSRRRVDFKRRYPELDMLAGLPAGCVVDGEIVALRDGRPDFHALLSREQRGGRAPGEAPVSYVVFDLLYEDFEPLLERPLAERRDRLAPIVEAVEHGRLVMSDGVAGQGILLFEEARKLGHEGVIAKRLSSRYHPGRRTDTWVKFKKTERVHCAIIGYVPKGDDDLKSVMVATDVDGVLTFVGNVGSGLTDEGRAELLLELKARERPEPLVPCDSGEPGRWVEPGLYCTVSFAEMTPHGMLRAPVFLELIVDDP